MADRHRSNDGKRETDDYLGKASTPGAQGRDGGRLARQVGTKDELKRARDDRAGVTRVTKSMEEEEGDK